ncbi:MAG TPA: acyl-CoA dehydrogenase family protein [Gordonia sp. (in: high G+C Gram-positive bacteria)]|uniref:acyl-CoA dehydrogenase family protein n=2 Tax=Gordonia TaxID=2053 RepID=UPI000F97F9AB|nr:MULTISPECIES: acyl-CoA dehydrogenase family protein [unclassified Gordonia (in: high G+C Gram-positive bacteria)]RUP36970.1 MAG: acyl-CoA dehydrogenase [Gordonia sp. (in: high G+C Gram-positive bacteria)]HNP55820.1 acyl-CoA dehydrogenase family protein [Gordonia sp. (in: high G+C Gram-positive bacteria)]HRC51569.1 acyl-CoA dehydrogenase family protein [Gordonia sp. (in: high G+C Gram-positive bacteria)]
MTVTLDNDTDLQARFSDALRRADVVAAELRATAAERDRANADPVAEIDLLRQADLLQVGEPVEFGGSGLDYGQSQQITRRIARGDTSIAHLLGYHYAQQRIPHLFGTPEQAQEISRRNAQERSFWGGVQNPRGGSALELTRDGDGYRLNGRRTFASGASVADWLSVTAVFEGDLVFLALPRDTEGFRPLGDWDNIGQRLTDSGGVEFVNTPVSRSQILGDDPLTGKEFSAYQTLVTPHWQLAFVNFYIGTAEGALAEALDWTRLNASAWETSGLEAAIDDPYILELVGELKSQITAAALLADRAGDALAQALAFGPELSAQQRAEVAVAIAEAKYLTTKVSLEAASRLFEIQGARATTSAYGFDRHWRNLRTHTVHDPVAYKAREVGDWTLNQRAPQFSLYS